MPRRSGQIGDPHAVDPLIGVLSHDAWTVRWYAVHALERLAGPRSIEPLIDGLRDPNSSVRFSAIRCLGAIGDRRCIAPLRAVIAQPPPGEPLAPGEPIAIQSAIAAIESRSPSGD